jgi:hypothetical protein
MIPRHSEIRSADTTDVPCLGSGRAGDGSVLCRRLFGVRAGRHFYGCVCVCVCTRDADTREVTSAGWIARCGAAPKPKDSCIILRCEFYLLSNLPHSGSITPSPSSADPPICARNVR